ncbi:MMPL family transporter [Nocardia pseudobrasiliensis]|uniref:RND superfamily putative drug exporter n=1 Tax=Nocardia pseudobrasiliensis TaxID=45979 RepID=A0A370HXE5_9NOCA|nr:MMPL family transporter [Nocardia pseudobrasiliensis]RDI63149.1 RND superfamily putative drug exporter [Nocardia pseudobrasiliensis]
MFTRWGDLVYRFRFAVLGAVVAALLGLGGYGFGVEKHLSSSGWFDPNAESSQAAVLVDDTYGRDHTGDVILLYTAPDGKTVDDPQFSGQVVDSLNGLTQKYPNQIGGVNVSYWRLANPKTQSSAIFSSPDKKVAFATVAIKGDNDTDTMNNFRDVKDVFKIPGVDVQVAGLQAVSGTLQDTIASDQKRMEMLAIPAVGVLLFFIFGGIVAAALPLIVGGLTIVGANGIVRFITNFTEVNSFVGAVVSMIGLGLAIDYGLFIVSRFREELAEGYDTKAAVRRSVMTAGRTVMFSAIMIIAASAGMLLFPQGFLKSLAYGTIATVLLAAVSSLTILPAILSILGKRVDALGLKGMRKTKTAEEVENGFWGRSTQWVMKHPLKVAIPLCIILLLLIIPVKNLKFGGISESYLPPDNPTRVAQEEFDKLFPAFRTNSIQLVIVGTDRNAIGAAINKANQAPGLLQKFATPGAPPKDTDVWKTTTQLKDPDHPDETVDYLRSMDVSDSIQVLIGGQPVMQKDSIDTLMQRMPIMIALVVLATTLLMFLTFGSLVLPIKAALMSALGLGSTLGILTWIFVDGHGAGLLNFTPQPIMSPVLVLIISIIYGLSTDYEVFLLSRMVEARAVGASTTEAVRIGTAQTGRIITAAALILFVVVGAFAFSDLVMMQYIAYGMVAALFIDATVLRMLLVPATMKLLGDDCWWAPAWMKRIQQKIGLGEPILHSEHPAGTDVVDLVKTTPVTDPVTMQIPMLPDGTPAKPARKPKRARFIRDADSEAPTERLNQTPKVTDRPADGPKTSLLDMRGVDQISGPPVIPLVRQPDPAAAPELSTPPDAHEPPPSPQLPSISTPQISRPAAPPRLIPPDQATSSADPAAPTAPVGATPRILPPQPQIPSVPPHPASRAQAYHPEPAEDPAPTEDTPPEPPHPGTDPTPTNRSSIEKWMSDLRSSRRRTNTPDPNEGKHTGTPGRTVSVNELLRRQNRD